MRLTDAAERTGVLAVACNQCGRLAPATLRGYRYDLRHFLVWHSIVQDRPFAIESLAEYELIAYRQHMVAAERRPATVNRRLDALRRLELGCKLKRQSSPDFVIKRLGFYCWTAVATSLDVECG